MKISLGSPTSPQEVTNTPSPSKAQDLDSLSAVSFNSASHGVNRRDFMRTMAAGLAATVSPFAGMNQSAQAQDSKYATTVANKPVHFIGGQLSEAAARAIQAGELKGEFAKALLVYEAVANGPGYAAAALSKAVSENSKNPLDKSQLQPIIKAIEAIDGGKINAGRHSAEFNASIAAVSANKKIELNHIKTIAEEYHKLVGLPVDKMSRFAPMKVVSPDVPTLQGVIAFAQKHGNQAELAKLSAMTNQTARWRDGERATFFKAVASLNQLHKDKPSHGELLTAANLNPRWAQNMLIKTAEKVEMMGDPKAKQPLMDAVLSANLKLHAEPDSKSALMEAVEVYSKVLGGR